MHRKLRAGCSRLIKSWTVREMTAYSGRWDGGLGKRVRRRGGEGEELTSAPLRRHSLSSPPVLAGFARVSLYKVGITFSVVHSSPKV